jgi:hypothetical protein
MLLNSLEYLTFEHGMDLEICANQIEDLHEQIAIIFIQTLAISTVIYKINSIL